MRVLITGAAGFLGSHLIPRLLEVGNEIVAVDVNPSDSRKGVTWVSGNITKPDGLLQTWKDCDAMIHLAAMAAPGICESNPALTFEVNVRGTYNVLKLARDARMKKVVFASSAHVYGISPKYMPTNETHPLALQDTYTTSKIIGESLCRLFYTNHNLSYIALRQYNGYGAGQTKDYFIPAIIEQAIEKGKIILRGRYVSKDFVYVDDMVTAMVKALSSDYVGELNVGTGIQTTLEFVADFIARKLGVTLKFSNEQNAGPTQMQCDPSLMKAIFGWSPTISVAEGLSRTIRARQEIPEMWEA